MCAESRRRTRRRNGRLTALPPHTRCTTLPSTCTAHTLTDSTLHSRQLQLVVPDHDRGRLAHRERPGSDGCTGGGAVSRVQCARSEPNAGIPGTRTAPRTLTDNTAHAVLLRPQDQDFAPRVQQHRQRRPGGRSVGRPPAEDLAPCAGHDGVSGTRPDFAGCRLPRQRLHLHGRVGRPGRRRLGAAPWWGSLPGGRGGCHDPAVYLRATGRQRAVLEWLHARRDRRQLQFWWVSVERGPVKFV